MRFPIIDAHKIDAHKIDAHKRRVHIAARRVRRGAELLDRVHPGWREKIQIDTLDISSTRHCILGQLYGSYSEGLNAVGRVWTGRHWGFILLSPLFEPVLQQAWKEEVQRPKGIPSTQVV